MVGIKLPLPCNCRYQIPHGSLASTVVERWGNPLVYWQWPVYASASHTTVDRLLLLLLRLLLYFTRTVRPHRRSPVWSQLWLRLLTLIIVCSHGAFCCSLSRYCWHRCPCILWELRWMWFLSLPDIFRLALPTPDRAETLMHTKGH
jgi:hypothetical protein